MKYPPITHMCTDTHTLCLLARPTTSHTHCTYLVLGVFLFFFLLLALVDTPDKIMEVEFVEVLTVFILYGLEHFSDFHLIDSLAQLLVKGTSVVS